MTRYDCVRHAHRGRQVLKKAKLKSKTLLSRLGGFSAFGFGVSLKLPEADRTIVRELLTGLEDRRALFVQAIWEQPTHVVQSVIQMRTELTNALKRLGEGSPGEGACRLMRGACRDFLNQVERNGVRDLERDFLQSWRGETFLIELGKLRATFGQQIALLAHVYDIELEEHLASILPPIADAS
jgi:hypothetical protein